MIDVDRVGQSIQLRLDSDTATQVVLWIRKAMGITNAPPIVRELQQALFEASQAYYGEDKSASAGFRNDAEC